MNILYSVNCCRLYLKPFHKITLIIQLQICPYFKSHSITLTLVYTFCYHLKASLRSRHLFHTLLLFNPLIFNSFFCSVAFSRAQWLDYYFRSQFQFVYLQSGVMSHIWEYLIVLKIWLYWRFDFTEDLIVLKIWLY